MTRASSDFEQFWLSYVLEHRHPLTRRIHFAGTSAAIGLLALGVVTGRRRYLALAVAAGYVPAWLSHLLVERNLPLTFKHPIWSLRADLRMFKRMLDGTMDSEVEQVILAHEALESADDELDDLAEPSGSTLH
ncbi:MAG TPA: DUF962 domain-containing protein [Polyangiaceae bacterium]|nr:DUF962 domain-containing protein [Polyangiaceae bacterium]